MKRGKSGQKENDTETMKGRKKENEKGNS